MYAWLRAGLFHLEPEKAHDLALAGLKLAHRSGALKLIAGRVPDHPTTVMGLNFRNPVGLAAGLDKNGDYIDALGALGFGFLELGTVTPQHQPGNPSPRIFRLPEHQALINRLGFNNFGVEHLVKNLKRRRYQGIVGANIGKQKETPIDRAIDDYRYCLERVFVHCDYITINVSSPNTADLRMLQEAGHLTELLEDLMTLRDQLAHQYGVHRPVLIKIAPDGAPEAVQATLEVIADSDVDGLIATNTTVERPDVTEHAHGHEMGGLSGQPLRSRANSLLALARDIMGPDRPIVGVGGIVCGEDAQQKAALGADLVQIYTGFIYQGPPLIRACVEAWPTKH